MPKQIIPKILIFPIPDVIGIRCGFCGSNNEFGCNSINLGFVRSGHQAVRRSSCNSSSRCVYTGISLVTFLTFQVVESKGCSCPTRSGGNGRSSNGSNFGSARNLDSRSSASATFGTILYGNRRTVGKCVHIGTAIRRRCRCLRSASKNSSKINDTRSSLACTIHLDTRKSTSVGELCIGRHICFDRESANRI